MSRKILGLDIHKDAVSAVLLQSRLKGVTIEAHAYSPLGENIGIQDAIPACLEMLGKQADISSATCIAAWPSEKVFYRNIRVPFKEQKKIRQILSYELEPMLPLPVEDLIIDFCLPGLNNQSSHTDILAGAVAVSELKTFMETLAGFKLVPAVVAAGGYAAAVQVAATKGIPDVCFFIDVGLKNCGLFVIIGGRICYVRSFSLPAGTVSKSAAICSHIQLTTAAVEEIFQMELKVGGIWISGCGAEDSSIDSDLAQKLQIPITALDLVTGSDAALKNSAVHDWHPLRLDNVLALALNELEGLPVLNFRKGAFTPRKQWMAHKKHFIRTGVLAAVIAALAFTDIIIDNHFMGKKADGLNAQITHIFKTTFPDIRNVVDPLQQMRVEIENVKKQFISNESLQKNVLNIDILHDISMLTPDNADLELNRIVIGPGNVQITGYTDTFNSVNNFQRRLQSGKLFKAVTINSANIEKSGKRVNFNLNLQL